MQLRVFSGRTVSEAMALVRRAMGDEVVILATDEDDAGVRITAARDAPVDDLGALLAAGTPLPVIERLALALRFHQVPAGVIERLAGAARESGAVDPEEVLGFALAAQFEFAPVGRSPARPLVVVGAPGVGKTVTVARLAAARRLASLPVAVASTDVTRRGGTGQLAALLEVMGLSLVAFDGTGPRVAPATEPGALFVDTAAVNPLRSDELVAAAAVAQRSGGELLPVLAADMIAAEARDQALAWRALGARRFVVSRVDTTRRLGMLLAVADAGLAFAGAGISPIVGESLKPLTATNLARLLLRRANAFAVEAAA